MFEHMTLRRSLFNGYAIASKLVNVGVGRRRLMRALVDVQ